MTTPTSDDESFPLKPGVESWKSESASDIDSNDQQNRPSMTETVLGHDTEATIIQEEAPIYLQTQRVFSSLEMLSNEPSLSNPTLSHEVSTFQSRFGVWCRKLGPHLRDVYSLDERLRDSSAMKQHVLDCLGDINDALEEAQKISAKQTPISSTSSGNKETGISILMAKSTISDPLSFANTILDILFRVIPIIRPALSADRYERAVSTVLPYEEEFMQTCSAKLISLFPGLSPELRGRLVSASAQRLRFFQYAANYSLKFQSDARWEPNFERRTSEPLLSMPAFIKINLGDTDSTASRADENLDPFSQESTGDTLDTRSMKSATMSNRDMKYKFPPFPEESEGVLRECVACRLTLPLPSKDTWKAHILRDIRPYICTFPDCTADPNKLYSSRRAWFEHELAFHRRQWPCPFGCTTSMPDLASLNIHIASKHPGRAHDFSSHPLPRGQEISPAAEAVCPFCALHIKPRGRIESHIALHQVQVGLMVLQSSIIEDSDDEDLAENEEEDLEEISEYHMADLDRSLALLPRKKLNRTNEPVKEDPSQYRRHDKSAIDNAVDLPATDKIKAGKMDDIPHTNWVLEDLRYTITYPQLDTGSSKALPATLVQQETKQTRDRRITALGLSSPFGKSRSGRHTWFLMPNFDFIYQEYSTICLGQVLTDPLRPSDGILTREVLHTPRPQKKHHYYMSPITVHVTVQREVEYVINDLHVKAMRVETHRFLAVNEYISEVIERPEIAKILKSRQKIFIITGLKVTIGSQVEVGGRNSNIGATVHAGVVVGAGIEAGIKLENSTAKSVSYIQNPVLFAYSLTQVQRSSLGSFAVEQYKKGAF
ncbi:uncharacterized protein LY89DRAFT_742517 [Mollisia scopiformis]|uniref:C2H2-type domain-containing protein n=1 Tax=Mollisia scopiformis TaxID=149040 RepID=A0A132B5Q3_MOLSC|nr:uncharacterized protein LY89DRAFT_742517 [Mollisia scopiformis]KUJ07745.1 hypothetical protein LY89DRAFT_742517 [Mollisia scopiformis]